MRDEAVSYAWGRMIALSIVAAVGIVCGAFVTCEAIDDDVTEADEDAAERALDQHLWCVERVITVHAKCLESSPSNKEEVQVAACTDQIIAFAEICMEYGS